MKSLLNFGLLKYLIVMFNLVFCITSYAVTTQCVPELSEIELEGNLIIQTHPGPPNYDSIEEGDRQMDVWVLHLDNPVRCIQLVERDNNGELMEFDGGSFIRIIAYDDTNLDLAPYENQHITIKGKIRAWKEGIDLLPMVLDSISMFNHKTVIKKKIM